MKIDNEGNANEVYGELDKRWKLACGIILGKPVGELSAYAAWLKEMSDPVYFRKSAKSGTNVAFSTDDYAKNLKYAVCNVEMDEGTNTNIIESTISVDSASCYRSSAVVYSKYIGYSFWPRSCQYLFGCDSPFDSNHCINIYSCTQQTRCFEIDCCGYCSDLYFGHNCENVHDSMFCFNVKNIRNAIGNAVLPPDKYKAAKAALVSQMHGELEKKKDLKWDIYNVVALAGKREK